MSTEQKQQGEVKTKSEKKLIKPLRDFKFKFGKEIFNLKKGQEVEVHKMFIQNLKTEKVIK